VGREAAPGTAQRYLFINRQVAHYPEIRNGGRSGTPFGYGQMRTWNVLRAASLKPTLACQKRQARMRHPPPKAPSPKLGSDTSPMHSVSRNRSSRDIQPV
jgi:hypothetical protein